MNRHAALDSIALRYVKLALALGCHDDAYIDAYYGPEEWRTEAEKTRLDLDAIRPQAEAVRQELDRVPDTDLTPDLRSRKTYLAKQLRALAAKADMLAGTRYAFDEESALLYDAVAPTHGADHFKGILDHLQALLPGTGSLSERYHGFMAQFVIPKDRLDAVFSAAVKESQARTQRWIPLPPGEDFVIEYVTGKPWGGYNWYKGNAFSVIQMNTDLPIYMDRAIDLASHEGYPGHHVNNALLETHLVRERQWVEFSVYPLFSPQSLIAEGTANFGIQMAFPDHERLAFEREVLFPLAGLDASQVERHHAIREAAEGLSYAGNEAARGFLDGRLTREQAIQWFIDYELSNPERAEKRLTFIEAYRSYVINYNLGQDMVKRYVESRGGTPDQPDTRWKLFRELVSTPKVPSEL